MRTNYVVFTIYLFLMILSPFFSYAENHKRQDHFIKESKQGILNETETRFILPITHWLNQSLDTIFSNPNILDSQTTIDNAGFITLYKQSSGMRVLKHHLLPGYLIKTYVNSEQRKIGSEIQWMIARCTGAEQIRDLIAQKKLKLFTVPDKWIYFLPNQPFNNPQMQTAILIVTDMDLVNREASVKAWKTKITRKHLRELYCILSHGFASVYLPYNIPYTNNKTFACVDTAYGPRKHHYHRVRRFLSEDMKIYWDKITQGK